MQKYSVRLKPHRINAGKTAFSVLIRELVRLGGHRRTLLEPLHIGSIAFALSLALLQRQASELCLFLDYQKANKWRYFDASQLLGPSLACIFFGYFLLKWAIFDLTFCVKMGYNVSMFRNVISFLLRIWLIAVLWALVWRFVEPRTQLMRIVRAALLLLGLLAILALVRITAL